MTYKSIDETAAQSYKQLSRALTKRINDNAREAYAVRGRSGCHAFDQDALPELSISVPINGQRGETWMCLWEVFIPSKNAREITMRVSGEAFNNTVDVGYHVRPLSRIDDPLVNPDDVEEAFTGGTTSLYWPIDISELNTGDPLVFLLYGQG